MEKDYIYFLHKLAYENLELGVSFAETLEYLKANGIEIGNGQKLESIQRTYSQVFIDSNRASVGFDTKGNSKFYMLTDSYYRYLEYLELVEARKSQRMPSVNLRLRLV